MKHTPGPWHVHEGGNFVRVGAVGYDEYVQEHSYLGGPFSVASVERNATEDYAPNHELAMANAQLIAKAPELLQMLKTLLYAEFGRQNPLVFAAGTYWERAQRLVNETEGK